MDPCLALPVPFCRQGFFPPPLTSLRVVQVDVEKNLLSVKGAVPGRPGTLLLIQG